MPEVLRQAVFVAQPKVVMVADSAGTALVIEETEAAEETERTEPVVEYIGPGAELGDDIGGIGFERAEGKENVAVDKDCVLELPVAFASFVVPVVARAVRGAVVPFVVDVAFAVPDVAAQCVVAPRVLAQVASAARPFAAPPSASVAPVFAAQPSAALYAVAQDAAVPFVAVRAVVVPCAVAVAVEVSAAPASADAYAPVVAETAGVAFVATAVVSVEETAVATEVAAVDKWRP
jgi:hypothetical protein